MVCPEWSSVGHIDFTQLLVHVSDCEPPFLTSAQRKSQCELESVTFDNVISLPFANIISRYLMLYTLYAYIMSPILIGREAKRPMGESEE